MIDPAVEQLITIPQAGTLIRKLTGSKVNDETIHNWAINGRFGVILETISRGEKKYTSSEAVKWFIWKSSL